MVKDWKLLYFEDLMAGGRYELWECQVPKVCSEWWVQGASSDWAFSEVKFSNFFGGEINDQIIWGITCEGV